jgi:uncharacterized membrane protein
MKHYLLVLFFIIFLPIFTSACVTCDRHIQEGIYNSAFYVNVFRILLPFVAIGLLVAGLSRLATRRHRALLSKHPGENILSPVPLAAAATVLGIGIGGFIDGIVLHQILQWHEMISNQLPPTNYVNKSVNMFWDGIFHAGTLIITLTGILLLWKLLPRTDIDRSGSVLGGGLLLGWGLFNLVEGIIDHQILKLHNVREVTANVQAWNLGFLAFSILLVGIGYWLCFRRGSAQRV